MKSEVVSDILSKIEFHLVKGGDLSVKRARTELEELVKKLVEVTEPYRTLDTYVKEYINGHEQLLLISGTPIEMECDYFHNAGILGLYQIAVGIRVGMGVAISEELIEVSKKILSKYSFTVDYRLFPLSEFRGTNFSTVGLACKS